eukprot:c6932_g2_i1.p1 GENE.c6932_g2_i1~~c6932_g2_i1.p1  ORF type:complete len:370 (-),score=98.43 c6932_g2_i1:34-1143(-)
MADSGNLSPRQIQRIERQFAELEEKESKRKRAEKPTSPTKAKGGRKSKKPKDETPTSTPSLAATTLSSFDSFQWFCEPGKWPVELQPDTVIGEVEGTGGKWHIADDGKLHLSADAKKDFWRKTYYEPTLIKDDAPVMYVNVPYDREVVFETAFTLFPKNQFDQAGIAIRLDSEHHVKAGIEFVDGTPRLSCVVTNGFSDWSTAVWPHWDGTQVSLRLRVHKILQGSSIAVEASEYRPPVQPTAVSNGDSATTAISSEQFQEILQNVLENHSSQPKLARSLAEQHNLFALEKPETEEDIKTLTFLKEIASSDGEWGFCRIAHVDDIRKSSDRVWQMGVFSACPIKQQDCRVVFHYVYLGPKGVVVHDTSL